MIIECGFLNKSAMYYYYIQNVILSKSGWSKVIVMNASEEITEYINDYSTEIKFEMIKNNELKLLKINNNQIMQSYQLFKVELHIIDIQKSDFSYRLEESVIVDH